MDSTEGDWWPNTAANDSWLVLSNKTCYFYRFFRRGGGWWCWNPYLRITFFGEKIDRPGYSNTGEHLHASQNKKQKESLVQHTRTLTHTDSHTNIFKYSHLVFKSSFVQKWPEVSHEKWINQAWIHHIRLQLILLMEIGSGRNSCFTQFCHEINSGQHCFSLHVWKGIDSFKMTISLGDRLQHHYCMNDG